MSDMVSALVVMGVAGCGKSAVGQAVATAIGGTFVEGDSYHPPGNIAKMRNGQPLDDTDRAGWLDRLGEVLAEHRTLGERPVLACSALKRRYRDRLRAVLPGLGFVFLELTPEEARRRVAARPGHFMPAALVDSQFATLEPPTGEALTLSVDASKPVDQIVATVSDWLRTASR